MNEQLMSQSVPTHRPVVVTLSHHELFEALARSTVYQHELEQLMHFHQQRAHGLDAQVQQLVHSLDASKKDQMASLDQVVACKTLLQDSEAMHNRILAGLEAELKKLRRFHQRHSKPRKR